MYIYIYIYITKPQHSLTDFGANSGSAGMQLEPAMQIRMALKPVLVGVAPCTGCRSLQRFWRSFQRTAVRLPVWVHEGGFQSGGTTGLALLV